MTPASASLPHSRSRLSRCRHLLYPGATRHARVLAALFTLATLLLTAAAYVTLSPSYCVDHTSETLLRSVVAAEGGRLAADAALRARIAGLQSGGRLPTLSNVTTHLLTVANKEDRGLGLLRLTSSAFGWALIVLGMGDARIGHKGWGTGFGLKIRYQQQYAASLPPDDLLIFVDAFDVLAFGGRQAAVEGYLRACARAVTRENTTHRAPAVLFSAEKWCWPGYKQPAGVAGAHFPCLNSGAYMGRAADVASLLAVMEFTDDGNDQEDFTRAYLTSRSNASWPLVVLDHEADVFLSMFEMEAEADMVFNPIIGRWRHAGVAGTPVFAHWNGWKKLLDVSLDQLMGRQHAVTTFGSQWPWCRSATPHDVRKRTLEWLLGLGLGVLALTTIYCVVMESALAAVVAARVRACRGGASGGHGGGGGWRPVPTSAGSSTAVVAPLGLGGTRLHPRTPQDDD